MVPAVIGSRFISSDEILNLELKKKTPDSRAIAASSHRYLFVLNSIKDESKKGIKLIQSNISVKAEQVIAALCV